MASKLVPKFDTSMRKNDEKKKLVRDYANEWMSGMISFPSEDIKGGLHKNADGKSCTVNMRTLTGTYEVEETTWRILGILPGAFWPRELPQSQQKQSSKSPSKTPPEKPISAPITRDPLPLTLEYTVLQLPQTYKVGGKDVTEILTKSKKEQILRVCFSDNEKILGQFRQELKLTKIMRKKYGHNKRFYDKFPRILAEGDFGKLKGLISRSNDTYWYYEPTIPKPFYIMEKVGPTLEEFRLGQRIASKVTPHCAIFLIIGCLNVLRLVHEAGIVVCDVRPSSFSIRLGPTLTLHRSESEVIGLVALTNLARARPYRTQPFKKQSTWAGTRKYMSPAMMCFEPPGPVDDVISCLYMLVEFLTGELPWASIEKKIIKILSDEAIVAAKEHLEKLDEVDDGEKISKKDKHLGAAFLHLNQVFTEVRKANGYDEPVNYDEVARLLMSGVTHREDKDRGRSTFAFNQPTMFAYRHGIENKDDRDKGTTPLFPADARTAEQEEIRHKVNRLYPCTKDKRKEEDEQKANKPKANSKKEESKEKPKSKKEESKEKKSKKDESKEKKSKQGDSKEKKK